MIKLKLCRTSSFLTSAGLSPACPEPCLSTAGSICLHTESNLHPVQVLQPELPHAVPCGPSSGAELQNEMEFLDLVPSSCKLY